MITQGINLTLKTSLEKKLLILITREHILKYIPKDLVTTPKHLIKVKTVNISKPDMTLFTRLLYKWLRFLHWELYKIYKARANNIP